MIQFSPKLAELNAIGFCFDCWANVRNKDKGGLNSKNNYSLE